MVERVKYGESYSLKFYNIRRIKMNGLELVFRYNREEMEMFMGIVKSYMEDVRIKICNKSWEFSVDESDWVDIKKFKREMEDLGNELGNLEMVYDFLYDMYNIVLMESGMDWVKKYCNKKYMIDVVKEYMDDVGGLGDCYFKELGDVDDEIKEKIVVEVCNDLLRVIEVL